MTIFSRRAQNAKTQHAKTQHAKTQHGEMAISERELSQMTRELDELHESTFPGVRKALDEWSANLGSVVRRPSTRRGFFLGAAGAMALGAAAACSGGSQGSSAVSSAPVAPPAPETYTGDLKVVALAAGLENLAVTAYEGALKKAGGGELGAVPPAVATFIQTVMKQHSDHAQAWNAVLQKANKPTISDAPLSITQGQVAMLTAAKTVPDVARLALNLENIAAQTYTFA
ncbi:MAG TPA: ferritin-like domain-containing protein, partial [Pseudonocardiaceae bacterium]|nr:ferritin-like domain-containing protein [Pseudonocardiaceae bacterium]